MKKLEKLLDKLANTTLDLDTDPDILALKDREILLFILQLLTKRFA